MKSILNISEAANLAIHALAYMATLGESQPASVAQIAGDLNVSQAHLAKVLQKLVRASMILSSRGAKGGFYFERDPAGISLYDILTTIDGPLNSGGCLLGNPVCASGDCRLQGLARKVESLVKDELEQVTLGDLIIKPAMNLKLASGQ